MYNFLSSPVRDKELELCGVQAVLLKNAVAVTCLFLDQPPGRASKSFQIVEDIDDSFSSFFCCRVPVFPLQNLGCLYLQHVSSLSEGALAAISTLTLTVLHIQSSCLVDVAPSPAITQLFTVPHLTFHQVGWG